MDKPTKRNQRQKAFKAFYEKPKTMLMVAEEKNIRRANICRYCKAFRERDEIAMVKEDHCLISGHTAQFLTTNPDLFPDKPQQEELFKGGGYE